MTRILYLDCFSGVSGDMLLGAFLDAGLPLEALQDALGSLGLRDYALRTDRVLRAGVSATKFCLDERAASAKTHPPPQHSHGHVHSHASHAEAHPAHQHDAHQHRAHQHAEHPAHQHPEDHERHGHPEHRHGHHHSIAQITTLIAESALSPECRDRAIALVRRLGEVEADIHQIPVERIHLHEVGALDSIIDIVGAVFAFDWFRADRVVCSPLNLGSGMVRCAHGTFPVPAPATARLLAGIPVYQDGPPVELTTPTGALLVSGYASSFGPMPPMVANRIGYGAGGHEFADRPNVLRIFVGDETRSTAERVTVLACEIDDMSPQLFGAVMDQLLEAGALDVYYTPVQMKKNRPGTLLTVLCAPEKRHPLVEIVFRETTTLGVRYDEMARECLAREIVAVSTPWGTLPVKVGRLAGAVVNAAPEFDACVRLARSHGVPVKDVQAAAMRAWHDLPHVRPEPLSPEP